MSRREPCAYCWHERDSHHRRETARPRADAPDRDIVVVRYGACLALWCECPYYQREVTS
jgi:hypothetical protein